MALTLIQVMGAGDGGTVTVDTSQFPISYRITGNPPAWANCIQCFPDAEHAEWVAIGWTAIPAYWGPSALPEIGVPWPPANPSPDPTTYE